MQPLRRHFGRLPAYTASLLPQSPASSNANRSASLRKHLSHRQWAASRPSRLQQLSCRLRNGTIVQLRDGKASCDPRTCLTSRETLSAMHPICTKESRSVGSWSTSREEGGESIALRRVCLHVVYAQPGKE